jgi:hypothetical protein
MTTVHFQQSCQKQDWKDWTKKELSALLNNAVNAYDEVYMARRW